MLTSQLEQVRAKKITLSQSIAARLGAAQSVGSCQWVGLQRAATTSVAPQTFTAPGIELL
jgi:putative effector of murein hydrolase